MYMYMYGRGSFYVNLCSILQHLKSTLAESTRERILYLTTLVTLSDRIAHDSYIPGIRRGTYEAEFEQAKARVLERRHSEENGGSSSLPSSTKRTKLELGGSGNKLRWSTVADMSQWVRCPLGLAPGQTEISPTMFDLPATLDGPLVSNSMNITTGILLVKSMYYYTSLSSIPSIETMISQNVSLVLRLLGSSSV